MHPFVVDMFANPSTMYIHMWYVLHIYIYGEDEVSKLKKTCSAIYMVKVKFRSWRKPAVSYIYGEGEISKLKKTCSAEFSKFIRYMEIEEDECMVSFDVTSLYTNVPIKDTLNIIKDLLLNDENLHNKISIPPEEFLKITEFVLNKDMVHIQQRHPRTNRWSSNGWTSVVSCSRNLHAGTWTNCSHYIQQ